MRSYFTISFSGLESIANQLKLEVVHAVIREQTTTPSHYQNAIAFNRIFMPISTTKDGGGKVRYIPRHGKKWKSFPLQKNSFILMPPNLKLDMTFAPQVVFFAIHFRFELIPGKDLFDDLDHCIHKGAIPAPLIKSLINSLKKSHNDLAQLMEARAIILKLVSQCFENPVSLLEQQMRLYEKYRPLLDFLNQRVSARITIAELAGLMQCSESSLSRKFHKDFQVTLKQYLTTRLVRTATTALALSDEPIICIASRLQFNNEQYFSRFIKKHTGASPRKYRNQFVQL